MVQSVWETVNKSGVVKIRFRRVLNIKTNR